MRLPGVPELIIILVIVIAIFGVGKLGNLGGSIGKAIKDFRTAVKDPNKDDSKKDAAAKPEDEASAKSSSETPEKPS
jgi:sec-independent protein translocase protein TatA